MDWSFCSEHAGFAGFNPVWPEHKFTIIVEQMRLTQIKICCRIGFSTLIDVFASCTLPSLAQLISPFECRA